MLTPYNTNLPPDLQALKEETEAHARAFGLDFYETIFEVVAADDLNEIAAYGGFPTRYPHWSFGMAYEELKKGYEYGLSKIYEMVINNDPCYAYLMRCNHTVDQKLVMAHVYGHCDFFKNNAYFAHTSRKMMDEMANHGVRVRRYAEKYGEDEVETFIDKCMSIDDLIDIHSVAIKRRDEVSRYDFAPKDEDEHRVTRFKSKDYMDEFINPEKALKAEEDARIKLKEQAARNFPELPEKDVLLFLIEYAPLKPWQRDVLSIVRDEAYYFAPQGQTKIINEGWACAVGDTLVYTDQGCLRLKDVVENKLPVAVSDGEAHRAVYDWAQFKDRETVKVRTRRGLELEGSTTHRLRLPDGSWKRLDELAVGDRVVIGGGGNLWATEPVQLDWSPPEPSVRGRHDRVLAPLVSEYETGLLTTSTQALCEPAGIPNIVDENVAAILASQICDGQIEAVPDCILRSPKSVVAAFLRGYYDCDGYAGPQGVDLSTSSVELSKTVQLLLLNFGILSRRRAQQDGCWHVHTMGASARVFHDEIGFGLTRKQEALREYVEDRRWFQTEDWTDEVVSLERGRADVYDVSVDETHRYAAQGFMNHNSFWHSRIMTERTLQPWECIDYADHHSGTMATYGPRLNPYKLGIELLRDIEYRWNTGKFGKEYDDCDDLEKRRAWDTQLGKGREKIFEVRRVHNDITFIDTFLTPEFCVQHKMFAYAFQDQAGQYVIESREFDKIKKRLLHSLTNFGKPWIYVVDGNYRNRGELLLRHEHNGIDLRLDHSKDTLVNLQFVWSRPVHLHTIVEGKPTLLSYDGTEHTSKSGGDVDDPRRHALAKT